MSKPMHRREFLKVTGAAGAGAAFLAACGGGGGAAPAGPDLTSGAAIPMEELIAAAQAEGELNTIALPHDWANYGEMIETYKTKYGMKVNENNPDAGSADELEAIRANKDSKGPQAPDVIDVGVAYGPTSKEEGLLANYKNANWDTIPLKDADGYWWAEYYGALVFEVSKPAIENSPVDWEDLQKPEYKGRVAMAGDVLKSNQSVQTVMASGISRAGGVDDTVDSAMKAAEAGLQFWKEMYEFGQLYPRDRRSGAHRRRRDALGDRVGLPGAGQPRRARRATPSSRSSSPRRACWPGRTPAASAPTPHIRMPPACGGSS